MDGGYLIDDSGDFLVDDDGNRLYWGEDPAPAIRRAHHHYQQMMRA